MTWKEFLARLGVAAVLTPVIHVVDQWGGSPVHGAAAWAVAAVAALALVFVGEWLWIAAKDGDL